MNKKIIYYLNEITEFLYVIFFVYAGYTLYTVTVGGALHYLMVNYLIPVERFGTLLTLFVFFPLMLMLFYVFRMVRRKHE